MAANDNIRGLLDQGLTCYGMGKVEEALQAWRQVLQIDPANAKAKEYIEFVEQSWGPKGRRPDAPKAAPKPGPAAWGDLYDFGSKSDAPAAPALPPAPVAPIVAPQVALQGVPNLPPLPTPTASMPAAGSTTSVWDEIVTQSVTQPVLNPQPLVEDVDIFAEPPPRLGSSSATPSADALGMVSASAQPGTQPAGATGAGDVSSLMKGAEDLMALDDFSGALELLDKALAAQPTLRRANELKAEAERELSALLSSKLGNLHRVPRLKMRADEIMWMNYDHRAGFVLSLVDGQTSFDDILSVSGLPQVECLRILVQFVQEKVIDAG